MRDTLVETEVIVLVQRHCVRQGRKVTKMADVVEKEVAATSETIEFDSHLKTRNLEAFLENSLIFRIFSKGLERVDRE